MASANVAHPIVTVNASTNTTTISFRRQSGCSGSGSNNRSIVVSVVVGVIPHAL